MTASDDEFFLITAMNCGLASAYSEAVDAGADAIGLSEAIVNAMDAGVAAITIRDLIQTCEHSVDVVKAINSYIFVTPRIASNKELYGAFMDAVAAGDVFLLLSSVVFRALKSGVSDRQLIHAMKSSPASDAATTVARLIS